MVRIYRRKKNAGGRTKFIYRCLPNETLDPKLADEIFKERITPESLVELEIMFNNGFSSNAPLKINVLNWMWRTKA